MLSRLGFLAYALLPAALGSLQQELYETQRALEASEVRVQRLEDEVAAAQPKLEELRAEVQTLLGKVGGRWCWVWVVGRCGGLLGTGMPL